MANKVPEGDSFPSPELISKSSCFLVHLEPEQGLPVPSPKLPIPVPTNTEQDPQDQDRPPKNTQEKNYKTFKYALQLLPQYRDEFPGIDYGRMPLDVGEDDWKMFVIREIGDCIPRHLSKCLEPYPPQLNFFDSQKPILRLCKNILDYLPNLERIYETLNLTKETTFQFVSQTPNYAPLNEISANFVLIILLTKHLPWENFSKAVQKNVIKAIEQMEKELRKLKETNAQLYGLSKIILKKSIGVFERGPQLVHWDFEDKEVDKESLRRPVVKFSDPKLLKAGTPTVGMIGESHLIICSSAHEVESVRNTVILGLLVLLFEHTIELLCSLNQKLHGLKKEMSGKFPVNKWNNILPRKPSAFQVALLLKANFLLKSNSQRLKTLCQFMKLESEFLYEFNQRFKILKKIVTELPKGKSLSEKEENQLRFGIGTFKVEMKKNEKLGRYLLSGDWKEREAALYITQYYLLQKY